MATKPWDSRLARLLVLPLRRTPIHPNVLTTLGLLTGLAAAGSYARGVPGAANMGAWLYLAAALLDHADGELARMTGKTSAFGHAYDRIADLIVKLSLFTAMGVGLRHGPLGYWTAFMGFTAGASVVAIFLLRSEIARLRGWNALSQPSAAGFELEDVLYIIAPITWLGALQPFVLLAGLGAPLFALWVARQHRIARAPALAAARERAGFMG